MDSSYRTAVEDYYIEEGGRDELSGGTKALLEEILERIQDYIYFVSELEGNEELSLIFLVYIVETVTAKCTIYFLSPIYFSICLVIYLMDKRLLRSSSSQKNAEECGPLSATTIIVTDKASTKILCHDCNEYFNPLSVDIDSSNLSNILSMINLGVRWHCPGCLENPVKVKSLQTNFEELKRLMEEKLSQISVNIENQLDRFESSIINKIDKHRQTQLE